MKVIVERASCESDGFSVLVDHAPTVGPISPPPGRTVLAPSARRAAGVVRRQLIGAANTSLKNTTNPSADSNSRTPPVAIHAAQPSMSRGGTAARAAAARKAAAAATTTNTPPSALRIERLS